MTLEELKRIERAAARARQRKRVFTPGKREALESTGRPGEPESAPTKSSRDIILAMKQAAQ